MRIVDLTLPVYAIQRGHETARLEELPLKSTVNAYTGMIYHFHHDSMTGTYIDFPGHIKETDDGMDAENYPLGKLYRVPATVIHLNRVSGSGGISAAELASACPVPVKGGALVVNALGKLRFDEIEHRSVFLAKDAVRWIIATGIHLFVSDVYENQKMNEGVFVELFHHGISTVCLPINLDRIDRPQFKLTVLHARFPRVTQLPCRVVAELPD